MTYTLSVWAAWLVAAALIGVAIGWGLRAAREGGGPVVDDDRVDELERELDVVQGGVQRISAERDRMQVELAAARSEQVGMVRREEHEAVVAERDALRQQAAAHDPAVGELRVRLWNAEARAAELKALLDAHTAGTEPPPPDLAAGSLVLGVPVRQDDLTLIEGVGPAIAELCVQRGITTWWAMANFDLEQLRRLLAEAGPKFSVQDPTSWPHQARLLANGQWERFASLAEALRAERSST